MGWYDFFSRFYDASLEPAYLAQRAFAYDALQLKPGLAVLDLPCGTGLSFDGIVPTLGDEGRLLAVDASAGMLAKATARVDRLDAGARVLLAQSDVHAVNREFVAAQLGRPQVDRLHIFLGLTAFPDWRRAFEALWDVLAPGGLAVVVDVHTPRLGFQGRMVNLVARADIRRPFWEPMETVAERFERTELPSEPKHGGQIWLCVGSKPL